MVKRILNQSLVYLLAGISVLADQSTKHLVRNKLAINESWSPWPWLAPYARVLHIENTGAAFGLFKEASLIFAAIAVLVAGVIILYTRRLPAGHWWMRIALGLQLGGAVGNLIDRVNFAGTVTDFISVGTFAIFNVADASISVGVALLAILMLFEARAERRSSRSNSTLPPIDVGEAS
ncbi:MAG: signal peptidase II [Anaerolineales bacterium]|nr:signal peptidase II [Anaerolineales bacterium]